MTYPTTYIHHHTAFHPNQQQHLIHPTAHCNTLQHTATHCNTHDVSNHTHTPPHSISPKSATTSHAHPAAPSQETGKSRKFSKVFTPLNLLYKKTMALTFENFPCHTLPQRHRMQQGQILKIKFAAKSIVLLYEMTTTLTVVTFNGRNRRAGAKSQSLKSFRPKMNAAEYIVLTYYKVSKC